MLWLASGSPRRQALLRWAGYEVEVHPACIDESHEVGTDPVAHALRLAIGKAATAPEDRVALGADTVVHRQGVLFDKPRDREHARGHLRALSGARHQVTTGVCVQRGEERRSFTVTTLVRFRHLPQREIEGYLATGEADDKAGAYGIQGRAGAFVAEVRGSWTNVVGLPLEPTLQALALLRFVPGVS